MTLSRGQLLRFLFALFFVALFSWMVWEAYFGYGQLSDRATVFPLAILIPALGRATVAAFLELRKPKTRRSEEAAIIEAAPVQVELQEEAPMDPAVERRRTLAVMAWVVGFFVGIWLLGWVITTPLATLLYLKLAGKEKWPITIASAALAWWFFNGIFDGYLNIPLSDRLDGLLTSKLEWCKEHFGVGLARECVVHTGLNDQIGDPANWLADRVMSRYFLIPAGAVVVAWLVVRPFLGTKLAASLRLPGSRTSQ